MRIASVSGLLKFFLAGIACSAGAALAARDAVAGGGYSAPVVPATLRQAWWIDGSQGLDISGLAFCNGRLLAVADKASDRFFSLAPRRDSASVTLVQEAGFVPPGLPPDQPVSLKARAIHYASVDLSMDFEGITCGRGQLYLLSERHNRLARFDGEGRRARWTGQKWSQSARAAGYLQKFNAESEGLAKVGDDFWIALERNPRGLLRLKPGDEVGVDFYQIPPVRGLDFRGRSEDIAGLDYYGGYLYTLERNAFAVCQRAVDTLQANWCVTYREVEESPEYVYRETRFGKGEGVAVSERGIFVVLDNNGVGRAEVPEDNRGLLIQLSFPALETGQR